jgi:SNF2 family DNA or RNA helicase
MEATVTESGTSTYAEILRAAALLAEEYDPVDSAVVQTILAEEMRTVRQVRSLWVILGKYRERLLALGVDHAALVPPPPDAPELPAPRRVRIAWTETNRGRRIAVSFTKDLRLIEVLKGVRKAPNGPPWYDGALKAWVLPDEIAFMETVIAALKGSGVEVLVEVDPTLRETNERAYESSRAESAEIAVPTKIELYPFQKAGVRWIEERGGRAMVADEPGLGKTLQALGYLARHPEALPAIVVCPATLKANWYNEILRFTSFKPMIISPKTSLKAFKDLGFAASLGPEPGYDIVIMNYDLFGAETPRDWIKALILGDVSVAPFLLGAGKYARELLQKAYDKCDDIEAKGRLLKVIGKIDAQKEKTRGRFVRASVNGKPLKEFMARGFRTLILDESHYCQDRDAQRTKAAMEISRAVRNVIGLTGTPILNSPKNLWSQIFIINRNVFPHFMEYGKRHCGGRVELIHTRGSKKEEMKEVWNFSSASNLEELERTLRSRVMIRRLKTDVLKELPEKIRVTIPVVVEKGLDDYRKAAQPLLERLAKAKAERARLRARADSMDLAERSAFLAAHAEREAGKGRLTDVAIEDIEKLKQLAVQAKFNDALKFIVETQEQQGKIVVFVAHHETLDKMVAGLGKAGLKVAAIDGRVPGPAREPIKARFQDGDLDILVCGIRAAGEGLTLTASHTVVVCEFDWNPARHQQAEDRVHRIGQTVPATIYYLVAVGTIEEKIVRLIESKREVVHAALGESERTIEEEGILDALLSELVEAA